MCPLIANFCIVLSVQQTLYNIFFEANCLQKKKGKLTMEWLHGGRIRVYCVFADHCKTGPLWRRLSDCHSAVFSSLNKVGVSTRTCLDQEIPPHSRKWTWNYNLCFIVNFVAMCQSLALKKWSGAICHCIVHICLISCAEAYFVLIFIFCVVPFYLMKLPSSPCKPQSFPRSKWT